MNILLATDDFLPKTNGIVSQVLLLKEELEKRNHRVLILTPRYYQEKNEKNVLRIPAVPFPLRPYDRIFYPSNKKIEKYLEENHIDIIHNHGYLTGLLSLKIAKKRGIPCVVTFHTIFEEHIKSISPLIAKNATSVIDLVAKHYLQQHDVVIAPSIKAKKSIDRSKAKAHTLVLHNGVNLQYIQSISSQKFLKKYHLDPQNPLIILVGRIDHGKNVDIAVKAFKKVIKAVPSARLAIIGDGLERKKIQKLITRLGLKSHVFITGFIDYELVISATKNAAFCIMTSEVDTLPTVAIEAIACGKTMVAIEDEAIKPIIKHNVNGILTSKNIENVAENIIKVLDNNALRMRLEKAAFEASQNFSIGDYVTTLEHIYYELLFKKPFIQRRKPTFWAVKKEKKLQKV